MYKFYKVNILHIIIIIKHAFSGFKWYKNVYNKVSEK